jgi:hypothetical protein
MKAGSSFVKIVQKPLPKAFKNFFWILLVLSAMVAGAVTGEVFAQSPQPGAGGANRPAVPTGSVAAPKTALTSYEADMGVFHVKLESGTAAPGVTGYKLSGGSVSIWLKNDPSKKITIEGANINAMTNGDNLVSLKGEGSRLIADFLKGPSSMPKTISKPSIETKSNGNRIEIGGFYIIFGVDIPIDMTFTTTGASGEGSSGDNKTTSYPEGTITTPGGFKIIPICKGKRATAEINSSDNPSAKVKAECNAGWKIIGPDGQEVTTITGDPHVSESDKDGMVALPLPKPAAIAEALDVKKQVREACIASAQNLAEPARSNAVRACQSANPPPPPPPLPNPTKIKLADLFKSGGR